MDVVVIVTVLFVTSIEGSRVVQTSSGPVKGSLSYNQSLVQYLGIKYGHAERFKQCEDTLWNTVYDASQPGKPCPQPQSFYVQETSEDCLNLNIFVPNTSSSGLPVMAFIHDVFYSIGNADDLIDGSSVSSKGEVIVVTYNYRLGVTGFLNGENTTTNLGLRDNIAALTWLRRNIPRFGGNRDDITLVGHSSAAMTVGLLLISPQAQGLFKRAIMMSGSPLSPLATVDQSTAASNSRRISKYLNCDNISVLAQCLATKPISDVIKAQQVFNITPTQVPFGPIVDGDVIPDAPEKLFKSQSFAVDNVMLGVLEDDGKVLRSSLPGLIGNQATRDVSKSEFSDIIASNKWLGERIVNKDIVKYMYTDWKNPNNDTTRSHKLNQLYSDCSFNGPAVRLADIISGRSVPTFFYLITKGAFNTTHSGYTHGDDVRGLFGQQSSNKMMRSVMDVAFTMWINFVKSGNPSHPNKVEPIWPTYTQNGDYITIATSINSKSKFLPDRMELWNSLLPSLSSQQLANSPTAMIIKTTSSHGNENNCPPKKDSTKALTAVVAVMAIVIIVMLSIIIYQTRILSKRQDSTLQNT